MPTRFTLKSLLLGITVFAVLCGWALDHYRLTVLLADQLEAAKQREHEIKVAVATVVDATETWLVAEAYKEAPPNARPNLFREILVTNELYDLWQLCEHESYVNSLEGVPADFWAYKILENLGCKSVDDVFAIALSLDQSDMVPDEIYLPGKPEYQVYRRFIEKAFAENSKP